ncbi:MAG: hypothetical protein ACR2MM_08090 [Flavobacteriaceae bacterium]
METNSKRHPVLNAILAVLNVGLEIILVLIGLGIVIGIWELLK